MNRKEIQQKLEHSKKEADQWDSSEIPLISSLRSDQKLLTLLAGIKLKKLKKENSAEAKFHCFKFNTNL